VFLARGDRARRRRRAFAALIGLGLGSPFLLRTATLASAATAAPACGWTQLSIPATPTWDGVLGDLGTFILNELLFAVQTVGIFILNVLGPIVYGAGCLVASIFTIPETFFQNAFNEANAWLQSWTGPLAPVVAAGVVGLVILILVWFLATTGKLVISEGEQDVEEVEEGG
jgi:hypothetical protein